MSRENFGSRFGAIMALAGSAVGLGNIWKFPYEAGSNGGGAFMLVYLFFVFVIGIPVMLSEFVIGRRGQRNPFGSFKTLAPGTRWFWFGGLSIFAAAIILSYYGTVAGWTLEYVAYAIGDTFHGRSSEDIGQLFSDFVSNSYKPLLWQVGFMLMCGIIIMSGVKNGIERCVKTMMPALFVLILLLDIRACTLDGAAEGLKFLFVPDFSKLTFNSVLNALGQSFFSLSLGMGALMTYASYISRNENLTGISVRVVVADTFVSILAGMAILPAVFAFGVDPSAGPNLVYITLPQVFDAMPLGYVWGIVFFVLLTFAALTSAISLLEVCVAYLTEELKFKRLSATALSTGVIAALGVLCTLSFGPMRDFTIFGRTFFDAFDALSSNIVLPVGGIFICLFVGWKMKTMSVYSELSSGGRYPMGMFRIFMFIVKYVAPAAILLILLGAIGIVK